MCSKTHYYYYYYSYFCSFFLVVSNLLNLNMSSRAREVCPGCDREIETRFPNELFGVIYRAQIPDGVDKEFKFVRMTITGALEQTL